MPRKAPEGMRDVPLDEERKARKKFLSDLRKRKWKKIEIEAAESGWEWAFDTGFDQEESDSDAAGDLADCVLDGSKKHSRSAIADCVYEGINAARELQRVPEPEGEVQQGIAEITEATGR